MARKQYIIVKLLIQLPLTGRDKHNLMARKQYIHCYIINPITFNRRRQTGLDCKRAIRYCIAFLAPIFFKFLFSWSGFEPVFRRCRYKQHFSLIPIAGWLKMKPTHSSLDFDNFTIIYLSKLIVVIIIVVDIDNVAC